MSNKITEINTEPEEIYIPKKAGEIYKSLNTGSYYMIIVPSNTGTGFLYHLGDAETFKSATPVKDEDNITKEEWEAMSNGYKFIRIRCINIRSED